MKYLILLWLINAAIFANDIPDAIDSDLATLEIKKIQNKESKDAMNHWLFGTFGLQPYKVNYLLPYGYSNQLYKSYTPTDKYKSTEAELQVSLKLNVGNNLFGLNESYYLSYSHLALWQIYSESSPFRETNYNPDGFVIFPIYDEDSGFNLRSIKFAVAHKSNGQGSNRDVTYAKPEDNLGNRSRSINYIYTTLRLQQSTLITDLTLMSRLSENEKTDDNPDIMDYQGNTELKLSYFAGKQMYTLMGRGSFSTGLGAVEGSYSYPLLNDAFLYFKVFSGYGESLIDYNNEITKCSVGFSFSR
ncbi:MAG: phospholipase A [Sulfurimonas sp.]|jgi:phospholipase A1